MKPAPDRHICINFLTALYLYTDEIQHLIAIGNIGLFFLCFFISRRALAREGDYEMMPVCACVHACVRACVR